jgi:hypothetical protein
MPPMSNGSNNPRGVASASGQQPSHQHQSTLVNSPHNTRSERYRQFSSELSSNGGGTNFAGASARSIHVDEGDVDAGPRANRGQPAPLFERLVTEEVLELKTYVKLMENQQRRLAELQQIHKDLEGRLEVESTSRQQLEATLEIREREWTSKLRDLVKDRDHWKEVVVVEQTKNSRLREQLSRKEKDIHQMLQRKVSELYRHARRMQRFVQRSHYLSLTANPLSMMVTPVARSEMSEVSRVIGESGLSRLLPSLPRLDLTSRRARMKSSRRADPSRKSEYGMRSLFFSISLECEAQLCHRCSCCIFPFLALSLCHLQASV